MWKLIKEKNYTEWYQFFINNKKKDDLSDAFLKEFGIYTKTSHNIYYSYYLKL